MNPLPHRPGRLRRGVAALSALVVLAMTGACGAAAESSSSGSGVTAQTVAEGSVWDSGVVHTISIDLDDDAFAAMIETYETSQDKEWIRADVTIDGTTFRDAGMRLKGNSSLRDVDADASATELPWLIDLDQFVDGQDLDGWESFVVRSNTSETALNEAVALELLSQAGLASQEAVSTRFSVSGEAEELRLVVQDLDTQWDEATFDADGTLYKSEAEGDWSYRGDDAEAYDDVFDIEAGTEDFAPLTDFLQWLEEASDEEFAAGLEERLDVDAFATYLALEDLIGNFDDIEGPGNNSFLRWDAEAEQMTVVAWDHNLAFGGMGMGMGTGMGPGTGGGGPAGPDGEPPQGFEPRELAAGRVGGPGGSNVLAERFRGTPAFAALYDEALERLQQELYDSGAAQEVLDEWTSVLTDGASDLVDAETIEQEAQQVASYFDGSGVDDTRP